MARVELRGGITQAAAPKPIFGRYVIEFTVAETEMVWDNEARQEVPQSTFWRCSWWVDEIPPAVNLPFKGDKVFLIGELSQEKKKAGQEGPSHTRIMPYFVTVTRRGREGTEELSRAGYGQPPPPQQQRPQQGQDPWATAPASIRDEPPF